MTKGISRRSFLSSGVLGAAGVVVYRDLPRAARSQVKTKIKEYRTLGRTGMRVSDVSLGAGVSQEPAVINHALDLGVNYVDTGERYFRGQSERVIGEVAKRRRKDFFITTKLEVHKNHTEEQLIDRFHGCLERLQTGYVDVLMLHNPVDKEVLTLPAFHSAFQKLESDGKVKFTGLSSHEPIMGDICNFAIEDGRFDVLLLVYNFMQEKAAEIIKHARQKNVGTTIMKVHAGEHPEQLTIVSREERQKLQEEADRQTLLFRKKYGFTEKEYFGAAIRWVLQNKDVGCTVMSMRNFEQAEEYVSNSGKSFTNDDRATLDRYAVKIHNAYCRHACGECESYCPYGVAVNDVLRIDTYFTNYRQEKMALLSYYEEIEENRKPLPCRTCEGFCEAHCRYGLPVRNRLISAHERLTM